MFEKFSNSLTESLVQAEIINNDDKEIYRYGILQSMISILNFVTTLMVGVLLHALWQSVVFIVAYIPLRHYAGGYHAKTPKRCYFLSILLVSVLLLVMNNIPISFQVGRVIFVVASIVILTLSPVGVKAKPLDHIEKKVYKRRTCLIWLIEAIISMIALHLNLKSFSMCMIWIMVFMAFMLLFEKTSCLAVCFFKKDSDRGESIF